MHSQWLYVPIIKNSCEDWAAIGPLALDHGCCALGALRPQPGSTATDASALPINITYLMQPPAQQHHLQLEWPSQQGIHEEKTCEQQSLGSSAHTRYTISSAQQAR
jgi:hypothetical protein